ncbi:hypothetical protein OROGR_017332 [Orobanche gracilis]
MNELDYGTDEPPPSPRLITLRPHQHQPQTLTQIPHPGLAVSSNAYNPSITTTPGQGQRFVNSDQINYPIFSNALSSPVRQGFRNCHLSHGDFSSNNSIRSTENTTNQTRDSHPLSSNDASSHPPLSSNDASMDMHADSPGNDSLY